MRSFDFCTRCTVRLSGFDQIGQPLDGPRDGQPTRAAADFPL